MATTTTFATHSFAKSQKKELCSLCKGQPYGVVCSCGEKFDFVCIQQHVETLSTDFNHRYREAGQQLEKAKDCKGPSGDNRKDARRTIENWKRKRFQDINDIAEKALENLPTQNDSDENIGKFEELYNDLAKQSDHVVHDTLDAVIELNQHLNAYLENASKSSSTVDSDESSLDAELQAKLNPILTNSHKNDRSRSSSSSISSQVNRRTAIAAMPNNERRQSRSRSRSRSPSKERLVPSTSTEAPNHMNEYTRTNGSESPRRSFSPIRIDDRRDDDRREDDRREDDRREDDRDETLGSYGTTSESMSQDEFEAGKTRRIDRQNPTIVHVNNDKNAATVCSHANQLIYNDFNKSTHVSRLKLVRNIRNPSDEESIEWDSPSTIENADDDEWIQDIIYSSKLRGYLLLNRARLRLLPDNSTRLQEFNEFDRRNMKRLSANDHFIYLVSSASVLAQGDEIILMNYDKYEHVCKTLRDVIPSRINRGAALACGEISDLAVSESNQVILGYRMERRNEVGVCLFNVTNDGREWSCVKQLLLNDCWHSEYSFTPRVDWSDKLQSFLLIEYLTGHLIMIDDEGQVSGECRFVTSRNGKQSAINLSVTDNNLLCVRYENSIAIHKLLS